jgi:hypothetical protein
MEINPGNHVEPAIQEQALSQRMPWNWAAGTAPSPEKESK